MSRPGARPGPDEYRAGFLASLEYGVNPLIPRDPPTGDDDEEER